MKVPTTLAVFCIGLAMIVFAFLLVAFAPLSMYAGMNWLADMLVFVGFIMSFSAMVAAAFWSVVWVAKHAHEDYVRKNDQEPLG